MKKNLILTKILFIKDYYLDDILHYKGYNQLKHNKDIYLQLFPDNPEPLKVVWKIKSFFEIDGSSYHTPSEIALVNRTIRFIKLCIYCGLTVKEINIFIALSRKNNVGQVSALLNISEDSVKHRIKTVCTKLKVKGYKAALKFIDP